MSCLGKGALTAMEDVELRHWMRAATVRTAVGSAHTAGEALQAFGSAVGAYNRAVEVSASHAQSALTLDRAFLEPQGSNGHKKFRIIICAACLLRVKHSSQAMFCN